LSPALNNGGPGSTAHTTYMTMGGWLIKHH
jgi:hypothetical protein